MGFAERYDSFLFDLDGVLYRGDEPIPRAAEAVATVRGAGKGVAFVTNNSSRSPASVAEKLGSVGISARAEEVATSAVVTAELLSARGVRTAFVIGEQGILAALAEVGIASVTADAPTPDVVVVGWDRSVDYAKLAAACVHVERGASLVGTNADASYPAPAGNLPGAGALLAAVVTTTGAVAEVIGKPHAPLLVAALALAGGGRPLMIGDRLDTDITGAAALGWDSLLVLTGSSTRAQADAWTPPPTYVVEDLGVFVGGIEVNDDDPPDRG